MSEDFQSIVIAFQSPDEDKKIRNMLEAQRRLHLAQAILSSSKKQDESEELKVAFAGVAEQRTSLTRSIRYERSNLRIDLTQRVEEAQEALHELIYTDKIKALSDTITHMQPPERMPPALIVSIHPDSIAVLKKDVRFRDCSFRPTGETPFEKLPREQAPAIVPTVADRRMALVV